MFEVEKKVAVSETVLKGIEQQGTFLGTKMITDTYFDTEDHRFTTNDIWLRERNCQFELKIGIRGMRGSIDHYEEIKSEREILKKLGLETARDLQKALAKAQIYPYATLQTIRRKYQIGQFCIDLDLAYFDDFIYRIAEIELLVSDQTKISQAEEDLEKFVEEMGFNNTAPIQAKLIAYLYEKQRGHYDALVEAGIVG
jgi:thiamine-triphosphatase